MAFLSPTLRITLCLVCIALSIVSVAMALGFIPDQHAARLESRKVFCENLAILCSAALRQEDTHNLRSVVQAAVQRNPEVVSTGLRESVEGAAGSLHVEIGEHDKNWDAGMAAAKDPDFVSVPLYQGSRRWGAVEVRFQPLQSAGWLGVLTRHGGPFFLFFGAACTIGFYLFMRLLLTKMETTRERVVPQRVRDTLDTLAEGVVILNKKGEIVMANHAFAATTGASTAELEGHKVSELGWNRPFNVKKTAAPLPWELSLYGSETQTGVILNLEDQEHTNVLKVNSTPILGDDGSLRGAIASFDNLTAIEKKNADLRQILQKLRRSRLKIQKQNANLKNLATKDPLTGCWNRRYFFESFATHWAAWERYGRHLCVVLIDIDHFKLVNDNHGHSAGDQVLQKVAGLLHQQLRQTDVICRYGGEEFCILLPQQLAGGIQTAERLREEVERLRPCNLPVTASFGVTCVTQETASMQAMVDQADDALYAAKRTGRNKVVVWDETVASKSASGPKKSETQAAPSDYRTEVPYSAVNVLLTTLHYRHAATADHCRRVADLCVATAAGILSNQACYLLEMAALMHDIGKLGVPDSILLKPGTLSADEWQVIKTHELIGEELVAVAFSSRPLTDIIRGYHFRFEGDPDKKSTPKGDEIPLESRILAIADAYDSMVSEQTYRKRRTQEDAIAELQRHAGGQFDPHLVEHFIQRIMERNQQSGSPIAEMSS